MSSAWTGKRKKRFDGLAALRFPAGIIAELLGMPLRAVRERAAERGIALARDERASPRVTAKRIARLELQIGRTRDEAVQLYLLLLDLADDHLDLLDRHEALVRATGQRKAAPRPRVSRETLAAFRGGGALPRRASS